MSIVLKRDFSGSLTDILIYSNNFRDHLIHIEAVLKRFQEYGIALNFRKSHFTEIQFLGHVINPRGIRMVVDLVEEIFRSGQILKI